MTHTQKPSVDSEMHELNAEADLLDQKTTVVPGGTNGEDTKIHAHTSDPDAQALVIESLRSQVQDLFSQVSQLNNKLVQSYDRVSDLEDELHVTSSNLRQASLKVSQLEFERTQHLSAVSTGLLVEKSHVTSELTRLMEKATEEAARRGQAESARAEIEKDLDDLSAGLFGQANNMVAEARIAEAKSARKLQETEVALRSAEEVVGALQSQMQMLESEKEKADRRVEEMRVRMGKGKWVDRSPQRPRSSRPSLLSVHIPYHEFLLFISHLRAIRPASPQPPAMSTLLPLPFLARLVSEDSDPAIRLDLAPSLNWLSRRSVLAAIHGGQLTIEPMPFTTLQEELAPPSIPASSHHTHIVCALCGMPIYSSSHESPSSTPTTPNPTRIGSQGVSWSSSLFKNVRAGEINLSTPFGLTRHSAHFNLPTSEPPSQIYVFRPDVASSGLPVSLPLSSQQPGHPTRQSIYPLCADGWCLARLRTTCSLWAFVRTSIVEKVWEEPPVTARIDGSPSTVNGVEKHDGANGIATGERQTIPIQPPPRKSKIGLGSIWGSMQRSLSGTREPEKAKDAEQTKEDGRPKLPPRDPSRKILPPPPPSHPSVSHAPKSSVSTVHRVPPPLKDTAPESSPTQSVPPPLPKRNRERELRSETPEPEHDLAANRGARAFNENETASQVVVEQSMDTAAIPPSSTPAPQETPTVEEPDSANQGADAATERSAVPTLDPINSSPAISRVTSDDSFSTPTEELSNQLSPHAQEETPTEAHAAHPSPTEDHAAPIPVVPAMTREEDVPVRTASPAPPPLPRRAAARARPSSSFIPHATNATNSDSNDADLSTTGETAPAPEQHAVTATATSTSAPASTTQGTDTPPIVGEPARVTEEPEQIAHTEDVDVATIAPNAADEPNASAPSADDTHVNEEAIQAPAPALETASVHSDTTPTEPTKPLEPQPADVATEADGTKEKQKQKQKGAAAEPDKSQCVGDATWEERTYKEIVRLREEMFWARVGAVVH